MPRVLKEKRVVVFEDFENVGTGGLRVFEDIVASTYTEPEGEGNPESQDLGELDPDGDMGDEEEMSTIDAARRIVGAERNASLDAALNAGGGGGAGFDKSDNALTRLMKSGLSKEESIAVIRQTLTHHTN
eukprot:SAG11_NODE_13355_length_658_cov_21.583184_2_plen_129_part_01